MEKVATFIFLFGLFGKLYSAEAATKEQVHIVLIGATGDLAKKYLWQGIFDLHLKYEKSFEFHVYAAGSRPLEKIEDSLKTVYKQNIKAKKNEKEKTNFVNGIKYYQLKNDDHFKQLGKDIFQKSCIQCTDSSTCSKECAGYSRQNILFYFSVPPSVYVSLAENVNKYCRPEKNAGWFRVVLEKPFGDDLKSAEELAKQLIQHLKEDEMYRIDHYLGKTVTRSIMEFRHTNNEQLGPLWNGDFIEKIDVGMTEKVDVKGRIKFYDKYGVIRDVIQNHVTEVLVLLTMEIPNDKNNLDEFERLKVTLLNSIPPVNADNALIGQYEGYTDEAAAEFGVADFSSKTETFAAAQIKIENGRWKGVPIILKAGKKLDTRLSWATVVFKRIGPYYGSIHFIIESSDVKGIFINGNLPKTNPPASFETVSYKSTPSGPGTYSHNPPADAQGAYNVLIEAAFNGEKDAFVSTESLLESWKIWTPILMDRSTLNLKIYRNESQLTFINTRDSIKFLDEKLFQNDNYDFKDNLKKNSKTKLSKLFSNSRDKLINSVASRLYNLTISSPQKVLHVALSGGSSAAKLFTEFSKLPISWSKIHIWVVDERCVALNDKDSNFKLLEENLLKKINIPFTNIHPMPVDVLDICNSTGVGAQIYEHWINELVPNKVFDMIVLGVGPDGHTASLFPGQPSLKSDNYITLSDAGKNFAIPKRMTMTYNLINNARNIFVLILGSAKKDIVKIIETESDPEQYPILGVVPSNGNLEWFIDVLALE